MQLYRDNKLFTVKCKICPEHKTHATLYGCTLVVDEVVEVIFSVQCHDCVASMCSCEQAIAFLILNIGGSEDPSYISMECYWKRSK